MADDAPEPRSWWTTVPGILTALAGLITACTGLYVAVSKQPTQTTQAIQSEDPCKTTPVDQRPISCLDKTN